LADANQFFASKLEPLSLNFETTPFVSCNMRLEAEKNRLLDSLAGFFDRESFRDSITAQEKKWILRGMLLTRAADNVLKSAFMSGENLYGDEQVPGKGFRSLGQEAIFAAALKLNRGASFNSKGIYVGDLAGPLIRDLGVALAFSDGDVETVLNAQVAKAGGPFNGVDLHYGCWDKGVLPAAAPLALSTGTMTGVAWAIKLLAQKRIAVTFIGDGGSSLGEWHESINLAAVNQLPIVFCLQNNQVALSTFTHNQSATRTFADKGIGYGISALTIDGNAPEEIAAAFAWAGNHARTGKGPTLIELVSMRMCGHAHHDDMLYLGREPDLGFDLPTLGKGGYVDPKKYEAFKARDPIATYAKQLIHQGVLSAPHYADLKTTVLAQVEDARKAVASRPWPNASSLRSIFATPQLIRREGRRKLEKAPPFDKSSATYLQAIADGIGDVFAHYEKSVLIGEDVSAPYGNAFMLLKSLIPKYQDRLLNTPIAEAGLIGALVGMGLMGLRPIGEMQFNDFVASGFNQLVNNAAKLYFRTGLKAPFVLRMPWGGLRRAGPYHSQDTSPWFYRTHGLKIIVPSTPFDARALMLEAAKDNDPVLFYEHIALYREPKIRQATRGDYAKPKIGAAAFRRLGDDITVITYGAYVHKALRCADLLSDSNIECDVLDLRSLAPLDFEAIAESIKHTSRVILLGEDSKTGSVLENIAARIADECFRELDAPVRVLGSKDTPVPYSPPLEDDFLISDAEFVQAVKNLVAH